MGDEKQKVPSKPSKHTFMDSLKNNFKKWSSHGKDPQVNRRKIVHVEPFKPEQVEDEEACCTRGIEDRRDEFIRGEVVLLDYHQLSKRQREQGGLVSSEHSSSRKRKTSFELFLSSIPKLDPVDRTVGWVLKHPDLEVVSGIA